MDGFEAALQALDLDADVCLRDGDAALDALSECSRADAEAALDALDGNSRVRANCRMELSFVVFYFFMF